MYPKTPALNKLRLATIADVARLATVAAAGFYYSPVFHWERPHHREHPLDTFLSYERMFADAIRDPRYIGLVVEDAYDPQEGKKTEATIRPGKEIEMPSEGESVIVGAATWRLEAGSMRCGQFMDGGHKNAPDRPVFDGGAQKDKSKARTEMLHKECDAAEEKFFSGCATMDMVLVHPAYWKRGHGTSLVKWGVALADLDRVNQGVVAAEMGEKLYLPLGFDKLSVVHVEDKETNKEISVGVLRYSTRGADGDGIPRRREDPAIYRSF